MKKELLSQKIFKLTFSAVFIGIIAMLIFSGGGVVAGIVSAITIPAIKAANIGDTDGLANELNQVFGKMSVEIKSAIADEFKAKGALSLTEIDAKLKELGIEEKTLSDINEALQVHALEFEKAKTIATEKKGIRGFVKKAFSGENIGKSIENIFKAGSGSIVLKAVGDVTTSNVSTDTGGNALLDMLNADEINDLRLKSPFIEDFATTGKTNKAVYTYVDFIPGEGDVDFIAEGGTKSQLDLDITVKTESPVKAAGYEILTEESMTDIPRMESNARGLLFKKYLLKRQNGILFGDGIGANPLGVTKIASLFNPASWAGEKVKNPNLNDCIVAAANQIYTTTSYTDDVEFYPNVAFVNPSNFSALRTAKDANGNYIFPSFTLFQDKTIDGIRIVPKNKIPAGYILIGDFTKLNVIDYIAYSIRIGWINDQFIKNLFTMLGEGRFYVYVKALEQRAFIYDTLDNIMAGIEDVTN